MGHFTVTGPQGDQHELLWEGLFKDASDLNGWDEMKVNDRFKTAAGREAERVRKGHFEFVDAPGKPLLTSSDPVTP